MTCSNFKSHLAKFPVVWTGHIRESRTELFHIWSYKRIGQMADVIGNYHKVTHLEVEIHTACCIGYKKILYPEHLHDTDRKSHQFHGITLIIMETALHRNNELSAKISGYEITLMSHCCGNRKSGYFTIRDNYLIFNLICKFTQTTT